VWYDCGTCKKEYKKAPDFKRINVKNQEFNLVTRTGIELIIFLYAPLMKYIPTIFLSCVWISLKDFLIHVWYKVWYGINKKCGTKPICKNK